MASKLFLLLGTAIISSGSASGPIPLNGLLPGHRSAVPPSSSASSSSAFDKASYAARHPPSKVSFSTQILKIFMTLSMPPKLDRMKPWLIKFLESAALYRSWKRIQV
uniref:Uncharacterized protein n=1 Tax=Cannabis sativa TaxID=3483 RepID=A0A803PK67_CANSA